MINAGLGISLIQSEYNVAGSWTLWLYGSFVTFQVMFQLTLLVVFTITALKFKDPKKGILNTMPQDNFTFSTKLAFHIHAMYIY